MTLFRKFTHSLICLFTLCMLATSAYGSNTENNSDIEKLQKRLKGMSSITADFVQHSFDGKGGLLQTLDGKLKAKAPGKFYWKTNPPYEQLMVTDGKTLWLYDEDLEQVTIQPLDKRVEATPALMLSGELDQINQAYDVYGEALQTEWHFVLIPKTPDALFDRLRLEFNEQNTLQRMIIKDEIGQKTILTFSNVASQVQLSDDLFSFTPPEGVDVITQGNL